MYLEKVNVSRIEEAIFKSNIPYEDVKIELVDHIASVIEYKMNDNPRMTFEQAYEISSVNVKDSIFNIRDSIRKSTLNQMIRSIFDFSNLYNVGIILLGASITFLILASGGYSGYDGLIFTFVIFTMMTLMVLWVRIFRIKPKHNYRLQVMKKFAWVPMAFSSGVGLFVCIICVAFLDMFQYWRLLENICFIPMSLAYGILLKTVMDTLVFNVHRLKEGIEINDMFLPDKIDVELV